jgi:hypothetical protein
LTSLAWQLDYLTGGSTDLVRLSVVSAAPLPPAAWLFGTVLVAMVCVSRRRKLNA